jgi:hypothetical protein
VVADADRSAREQRRFDAPNFLWYFGALVAMAATGLFVDDGWERHGAGFMLVVSLAFLAAYVAASYVLLRYGWQTAGGLFAAMAVSVVPLVVYAFQRLVGWWPEEQPDAFSSFHQEILASWIAMELVTIGAGAVVLYLVRFPLVFAPIAFVGWYLSMDLAPALFGDDVTSDERAAVSLVAGLTMIGVGFAFDARRLRRLAYWPHLFGLLTLLGTLCWLTFDHNDHLTWALVTLASLATAVASVPLSRVTYAVFGALGLLTTVCYWAFEVFEDSLGFPFAVAAAGIACIGLGLVVSLHGAAWREMLLARLGNRAA